MRKHVATLLGNVGPRFSQALAAPKGFYESLDLESAQEVEFYPVDIGDGIGPWMLVRAVKLANMARRMNADILHCHGYKAAVPGVIAARLAGAKAIVTGHNLFPSNASALSKASLRFVARLSKRIIAVAPAVARSLTDAGVNERKIETIWNGIDLSICGKTGRNEARRGLGIKEDLKVILCVARLTEVKGVEHLIRAAPLILTRYRNAVVLIVGDGPDREKLQALAGQISPRNVWFFGQRYDVPVLLAAADVVAIPSLAEGHPMILIEAMASGKPIVASSVGGIVDAVEDGRTGLLIPSADPEALAEAIIRVLDSSNLALWLGSESRRLAEQKFAVEQMIRHTEEVYLCVVS